MKPMVDNRPLRNRPRNEEGEEIVHQVGRQYLRNLGCESSQCRGPMSLGGRGSRLTCIVDGRYLDNVSTTDRPSNINTGLSGELRT